MCVEIRTYSFCTETGVVILKAQLYQPILHLLQDLEIGLEKALHAEEPFVQNISRHLLNTSGKRIRPALFFLSLNLWKDELQNSIPVAVAIELLHSATLVHDDVVDMSELRRGQPTVNAVWGNQVSVLTGDYLFSRAFSILTEYGDLRLINEMAVLVGKMTEGEIQQQTERFNPDLDQPTYLKRIGKKTAYFFEVCARCGGKVAGANDSAITYLGNYGYHVGLAFQIMDDLLDFFGDEQQTGKPTASDLRQGIVTLPVIHLLSVSPNRRELRKKIAAKEVDDAFVRQICRELEDCHSLEHTRRIAHTFIDEALHSLVSLPARPGRITMEVMARFVIENRLKENIEKSKS